MITQELNTAIELIRYPERMDRSTIEVLRTAIEQNPYYQTLYLLLLQNLCKVRDPQFGEEFKKYAPMIADRSVLFDMMEGAKYNIPVHKLSDDEEVKVEGDRTLNLVDRFLHGLDDSQLLYANGNGGTDPNDYSSVLEMLPDFGDEEGGEVVDEKKPANVVELLPVKDKTPKAPRKKAVALDVKAETPMVEDGSADLAAEAPDVTTQKLNVSEDEFTVSEIRKHLAEDEGDLPLIENADELEENVKSKEYFTETMAGIYIKQQKYEQALEIIKALSIDNPKKNAYFADQIRYLELLLRINKNKK